MSFIKKNINFGLLMLIIVLAITVAAIGIYYNQNYSTLSKKYTEQVSNLQQVTDDLLFHKSRLNQTTEALEIKEEDTSELGRRYNEASTENENMKRELTGLRSELLQKNTELVEKTNILLSAQSQVAALQIENEGLQDDVTLYKAKSNNLEDDLDSVCANSAVSVLNLNECT